MMSSTKMIEKLKQSLHGMEWQTECKTDEPEEIPLSYLIDYLTPALMEEARSRLNETEETKTKGLEEMRSLIKKETKLSTPTDDNFLLTFLRSRKFNVRKAFKLLQNYWSFRKEHRSIYDSSDTSSVKRLILRNYMGFLPHRDKFGSVVMVFKLGLWDPHIDGYEEIFRAVTALLLHSIQYPATQVAGYRMIMDMRGLTWTHLKMCTPANILLMIRSTQHCFPARYRGIHMLSENKVFNSLWAIVYPLLTSKIKKRVMLHGNDVKPLSEYIHPSVLPIEYGGTAGPFENSKWKEVLDSGTENIMRHLNYGYYN